MTIMGVLKENSSSQYCQQLGNTSYAEYQERLYICWLLQQDPNVIFNGLPSLHTAAYDKWQEQHQAGECCELCVLRFLGSQGATYQNQKWSNIVTSIFHMF